MQQVLVPLAHPRKECPWESPCVSERTRYGCGRRHIWIVVVFVGAIYKVCKGCKKSNTIRCWTFLMGTGLEKPSNIREAPKPSLRKGRCQPNRLTEGSLALRKALYNVHYLHCVYQPLSQKSNRFLPAPLTQGSLWYAIPDTQSQKKVRQRMLSDFFITKHRRYRKSAARSFPSPGRGR